MCILYLSRFETQAESLRMAFISLNSVTRFSTPSYWMLSILALTQLLRQVVFAKHQFCLFPYFRTTKLSFNTNTLRDIIIIVFWSKMIVYNVTNPRRDNHFQQHIIHSERCSNSNAFNIVRSICDNAIFSESLFYFEGKQASFFTNKLPKRRSKKFELRFH